MGLYQSEETSKEERVQEFRSYYITRNQGILYLNVILKNSFLMSYLFKGFILYNKKNREDCRKALSWRARYNQKQVFISHLDNLRFPEAQILSYARPQLRPELSFVLS